MYFLNMLFSKPQLFLYFFWSFGCFYPYLYVLQHIMKRGRASFDTAPFFLNYLLMKIFFPPFIYMPLGSLEMLFPTYCPITLYMF